MRSEDTAVGNAIEPQQEERLADNAVILFGEKHLLQPLKGRQARMMFPKLMRFVAYLIDGILASGMDIRPLLNLADVDWGKLTAGEAFAQVTPGARALMKIVVFLSEYLSGQMEFLETEIIPFLLQVPAEALEQEGEMFEVWWAVIRAIRYYILFGFTSSQRAAISKLFQEAQRRTEAGEGPNPPQ